MCAWLGGSPWDVNEGPILALSLEFGFASPQDGQGQEQKLCPEWGLLRDPSPSEQCLGPGAIHRTIVLSSETEGSCSHPRASPSAVTGGWREAGHSSSVAGILLHRISAAPAVPIQPQSLVWSSCPCCFPLFCARTAHLKGPTQCQNYICGCDFKAGIILGSPTLQDCTSTWSQNGKLSQNGPKQLLCWRVVKCKPQGNPRSLGKQTALHVLFCDAE